MNPSLITPPSVEPLSLSEVKLHLRVDLAEDDAKLLALISAARQYAEQECQRSLITQQWRLVLDCFPGCCAAVQLDRNPVQSVESIQYLDTGAVWQTMPSTDWVTELQSEPARITPVFGKIWPISLPQIGAVKINFTAGYGNATDVPQGIKAWMLIRIADLYENRQSEEVSRGNQIKWSYIDRLLDPYRVVTL